MNFGKYALLTALTRVLCLSITWVMDRRWLEGDILTNDDVATLTNGLSLPFFVNMTCWNGCFQDPDAQGNLS